MVLQRGRWIITAVCLLFAMCMGGRVVLAQETVTYSPDMLAIQGRWVRTDAPYVIELRPNQGDGVSLYASYFNPKPIHVGKTEIVEKDGLIHVLIVLQDVNYQGSFYFLSYDREKDTLQGSYFHAASRQQYDVDFARKAAD